MISNPGRTFIGAVAALAICGITAAAVAQESTNLVATKTDWSVFTEPKDGIGPIRVSLRSKGQIDVAQFAEQFAGGGHARAAGLKLDGSLESIHARVVVAILSALRTPT